MTKPPEPGRGLPTRSSDRTPSGLELPSAYPAPAEPHLPGEFPFTRGIHRDMYRGRLWTFRQYAGFGSVRETNERFRYLLAEGQTGISVAFDLPTQIGYDSDDPLAMGEVGKVGVPISTVDDVDALFAGIRLEEASVSMTINSTAAMLLAFLVATARRRGIALERLRGTVQNDMLKEFIARKTDRFPLQPSIRIVTEVFDYCRRELPHWNPISVSGYHMREAGSNAVQEVGFTLANALQYFEAAKARGVPAEYLARRISFFWNAHNHLLEEVAKFRAARRLWAKLVRERLGLADPECCRMRFHAQTGGSTLTSEEPENNAVRVAVQALAAVLGGTQSLHTNGMDEALGLPSKTSARVALRTQQIIAFESGAADVADPLGGAPAIEALTDAIEDGARRIIAQIDALGGALTAIENGYQQASIDEEAYRHQRAVESGERVVVGAIRSGSSVRDSATSPADARSLAAERVDPALEETRVLELRRWKASRAPEDVARARRRLGKDVAGGRNVVEALVDGAEARLTIGEMAEELVTTFGEQRG
jgi:methylmalonyl-CoA mutase N-terminal domain/subunit